MKGVQTFTVYESYRWTDLTAESSRNDGYFTETAVSITKILNDYPTRKLKFNWLNNSSWSSTQKTLQLNNSYSKLIDDKESW